MPLTVDGLVVQRYSEILDELVRLERLKIDPTLEISDDEFLGQHNQIDAERLSNLYALAEIVLSSFNINEAPDGQLDVLGLIKDIPRQAASPTQGYQLFTGDPNTTVPASTTVQNIDTGDNYSTRIPYQITNLNLVASEVSVATVADDTTYNISINGELYSIDSGTGATEDSILLALETQINADVDAPVIATKNGTTLELAAPNYSRYSQILTSNLSFDKGTVLGYVYASENGPLNSNIGRVTKLVTSVLGIDSTTNPYTYIQGSSREDTETYRARLRNPSSVSGKATVPAIRAAVRAVTGVSYATLINNNTNATVDSVPAKTYHVIVEGGLDTDIAEAIYDAGGAGISTYGTTTEVVIDEDQSHEISFSRPTGQFIAVRVSYTPYDEEIAPDALIDLIRQAVFDHVNSLGIGVDVIPGRMFKPIYDATAGIGDLVVEIQPLTFSGETPSPSWSTSTLPIPSTQFAQTGLIDIVVLEV